MNYRIPFLFLSLLLAFSLTNKAAAQTNDFSTQLKNVADKIRAKTVAWKTPEADLAPELKELDAIYAQHKGGKAEEQKLKSFLKTKEIPWAQYFDGKGWQNKLAAKYGIQSVPATFLLDGDGKIIGQDLRGEALEEALAEALADSEDYMKRRP